jgi:hypothetical protein
LDTITIICYRTGSSALCPTPNIEDQVPLFKSTPVTGWRSYVPKQLVPFSSASTTLKAVVMFCPTFSAQLHLSLTCTTGILFHYNFSFFSFLTKLKGKIKCNIFFVGCLCSLVIRVPGYGHRGPDSIPGATKFF